MSVMEVTLNANSIGGPFLVAFGLKRHRQNMRNSSLAGAMFVAREPQVPRELCGRVGVPYKINANRLLLP
jgi:hypothetical protein